MIICNKCGKENQDRYKFCLGCGAQLSAPEPVDAQPLRQAASSPSPFASDQQVEPQPVPPSDSFTPVSPTPPAGLPKVPAELAATEPESAPQERTPADPRPIPPSPSGSMRASDVAAEASKPGAAPSQAAGNPTMTCSSCGVSNPKDFVFCGNCGSRLKPAGQATTGLRSEPAVTPWGKLLLIRPDGSEGGTFSLKEDEINIGRGSGPMFDSDSYLSPNHLKLHYQEHLASIEDAGSLNGVFVKLTQDEPLQDGDVFRIGQELLRFDIIKLPQPAEDGTEIMGSPNPGYSGRLSIIVGPGIDGSAFPLMGEEIVLGRERGDILFSDDGYVSGTHAKIILTENGYYLRDLGSSNGTFIKINEQRGIASGTFILMGQQLFRIDYP